MFNVRLEEYRNSLGLLKREMANKLEMSESYYNMIENAKREPSRKFIDKLVNLSGKPEEYWIYGIKEDKYVDNRNHFKSSEKLFNQLIEIGMIEKTEDIDKLFNNCFKEGTIEELIIKAYKTDIEYLLKETQK